MTDARLARPRRRAADGRGRRSCSPRWSARSDRPAPAPATRRSCWPTGRSRGSSAGRAPSRPPGSSRCGCCPAGRRGCCGSRRGPVREEHAEPAPPGVRVVDNPCLSGGTLEIFLEPVLPPALVLVVGEAPVARALVRVGAALDHDVRVLADPAGPLPADTAAVVLASHGRDEAPVLAAALRAGVPYVALVASRRRAAGVLDEVAALGVARHLPGARARGLDIGARTPAEIALSIYAQFAASRPARTTTTATTSAPGRPRRGRWTRCAGCRWRRCPQPCRRSTTAAPSGSAVRGAGTPSAPTRPGTRGDAARDPGRRRRPAGRPRHDRLPHRRRPRDRTVPRGADGAADPAGGRAGRREDPGGQGARRAARHPAAAACSATRGSPRPKRSTSGTTRASCCRSGSPSRVGEQLSDADLFTPEHLLAAAVAGRDRPSRARGPRCCSSTRSTAPTTSSRRSCSRCWPRPR